MARIQQVIDDLTGAELNEDVEPTTITVDGTKYSLDLGSASKERLVKWLSGEGSITQAPKAPASSKSKSSGTRAKTETYGYDFNDVRAYAIANGLKAANGNPVNENTPRLGQPIYDAYHEAQGGK